MSKHVAVLMGGWSSEREVSLASGANVAAALGERGYRVTEIDAGRDLASRLGVISPKPDVVFNALHGQGGEDGSVQGLLEVMGLRYTHSGVLASALAMDKPVAKVLFRAAGIPCPEGRVIDRDEALGGDPMPRPYVLKPLNEGSSVGVHIVGRDGTHVLGGNGAWKFGARVLVERYIPGRELTVAVMGDRALGVLEIRPRQGFYDYAAKYKPGYADHLMPAPLPETAAAEAMRLALLAHRTLGCAGVSRSDFRYDDTERDPGRLYLLEVNTQPGMTSQSLVPEIAAFCGISFGELVAWMVENASCGG